MPYKRPTKKQIIATKLVAQGESPRAAMKKAKYAPSSIEHSSILTESNGFQEVMLDIAAAIPDKLLVDTHLGLLKSSKLEHMVFPPFRLKEEIEEEDDMDDDSDEEQVNEGEDFGEQLTDDDIRDMLSGVNCTVRKIVHGDMARHVYFFAADNKARKDGLDMAYELKNKYPTKSPSTVVPIQFNIGDFRNKYKK